MSPIDMIDKTIDICEDVEVLHPQAAHYILAEVKPSGRIHAVFDQNRELYIVFTDNKRELFAGDSYLGGIMIDHQGNGYAVRYFYINAEAMLLSKQATDPIITPFGNDGAYVVWNVGNHDRLYKPDWQYAYREFAEDSLESFEKSWIEASELRVGIKLNDRGDGLKF